MYKTEGFIEQHFHGAFGIDFMNCSVDDVVALSVEMVKYGTTIIFPTLMTGDIAQIQKQISVIKAAQIKQPEKSAKIAGIHLEGPFINPQKKGIHQAEFILKPTIENYQKIEDEIVKIVTVAPESDENRSLCQYLSAKGVKVQAGHTLTDEVSYCSGATHLFNAMGALTHKNKNIISSSLVNDNFYVEVIADGNHVVDDVLKLLFKAKPLDKILLISDALPIAHGKFKEGIFAGQKVYFENGSFYNRDKTLAGSGRLQIDIMQRLVKDGLLSFEQTVSMMSKNFQRYLGVKSNAVLLFDDELNLVGVDFI